MKKKCPVFYIRWIPKDDELFTSHRPGRKGHFICISFFYDHTGKKSILIANPNAHDIEDGHEVAAISSYVEENDVNVYHTRDYLQFDDTFCCPSSLLVLRALYNIDQDTFESILQEGQQKNVGNLKYISVQLGYDVMHKEVGKISAELVQAKGKGEEEQDKQKQIAELHRQINYETALVCAKNHGTDDMLPFVLNDLHFNQRLIEGNFSKDQKEYLSKVLLSGKKLLTPEQIQQVTQNRQVKLARLSQFLPKQTYEGKSQLNSVSTPVRNNNATNSPQGLQKPKAEYGYYYISSAVIGLISGLVALYLFAPYASIAAPITATIIGALVGVGICYGMIKLSEKGDRNISTILDDSTTVVLVSIQVYGLRSNSQ
ncbi:hypothetical protein [Wolbachia endosymbiont of Ctenocephalides felis wCfeT]|uniref:hypothetical protein n=1 Tax=Wolbachia endosymbiont of Ctenocephalides felis wCfeT TaxID=2732593 RepID=UPI001444DC39|nr:hypothetical protein [Wolbachia endosymbiont of Ctenocephalides felis wCfeT]